MPFARVEINCGHEDRFAQSLEIVDGQEAPEVSLKLRDRQGAT
jgi:hypothetical protein